MPEFIHHDQLINYELCLLGDARSTPVLMLHGNGEDMEIFADAAAPLISSKNFVFMDSRLHGRSHALEGGSERLSYELIASDALALMEHLSIHEYDVIGYSDGGIAALIMAMNTKDIRRVITLGANIDPSGLTLKARHAMRREYEAARTNGDARTCELMRLMLEEPHITRDDLSRIIAETTIVLGSRDDLINKKHSESIADAIPRGSHVYMKGAGHEIPVTHPAELAELIRTLL